MTSGSLMHKLSSNVPQKLKIFSIFAAPPTIVKFPENGIVLAEKGDEVSLSCVGEGKPEPVITWTRVVRS